ncbi:MAG: hypothetical protein AAB817_02710, partial [Patescibacteria group bacterium]
SAFSYDVAGNYSTTKATAIATIEAPQAITITPAYGTVESYVVITGEGFGGTKGSVSFTDRSGAPVIVVPADASWNSNGKQIGVNVPQGAVDGSVRVISSLGDQSDPLA